MAGVVQQEKTFREMVMDAFPGSAGFYVQHEGEGNRFFALRRPGIEGPDEGTYQAQVLVCAFERGAISIDIGTPINAGLTLEEVQEILRFVDDIVARANERKGVS